MQRKRWRLSITTEELIGRWEECQSYLKVKFIPTDMPLVARSYNCMYLKSRVNKRTNAIWDGLSRGWKNMMHLRGDMKVQIFRCTSIMRYSKPSLLYLPRAPRMEGNDEDESSHVIKASFIHSRSTEVLLKPDLADLPSNISTVVFQPILKKRSISGIDSDDPIEKMDQSSLFYLESDGTIHNVL